MVYLRCTSWASAAGGCLSVDGAWMMVVGDHDLFGLDEAGEEHRLGVRVVPTLGDEAGSGDGLAQLVPTARRAGPRRDRAPPAAGLSFLRPHLCAVPCSQSAVLPLLPAASPPVLPCMAAADEQASGSWRPRGGGARGRHRRVVNQFQGPWRQRASASPRRAATRSHDSVRGAATRSHAKSAGC